MEALQSTAFTHHFRDQSSNPARQNRTEQEQLVTPQQNIFEKADACGIYTVLSSMHAIREWSIDFVEQSHINNAWNWMAVVRHEIKETVSLERCECGMRYEPWGRRPVTRCSEFARIHVKKTSPGETGPEQGEKKGKRAMCENSDGKGERKREKIQHPQEAVEKNKTHADIRLVFSDPSHGLRVGLSASSLTKPFEAPILRQEVDHDLMPMDTYEGSSKPDVTLLQQTAVPRHLVTVRPFS